MQDWAFAIGRLMRDLPIVAQVSDPPAAQRDQTIAQIGQMRTTQTQAGSNQSINQSIIYSLIKHCKITVNVQ